MFKHLFTLIWNKKKQNFLLLTEMIISFFVLFAVFSMLVYNYRNYRQPMGFTYENVWSVSFNNSMNKDNTDSLLQFYETLRQNILALPQVKGVSYTNFNVPFSQSTMQTGFKVKGKEIQQINRFDTEAGYAGVLDLKLTEGRWFNKADAIAKNRPVVINQNLRDDVFGNGKAVGELIGGDDDAAKKRVIGVVQAPKFNGDYQKAGRAMFDLADTGSYRGLNCMLVKVAPGADAAFESRLYKTIAQTMKDSNIEIEHLDSKRKSINYFALVPMIVLSIICGFLIINVALGLFGVLWYNINQRRGEIGLRRAMGATGQSVSIQLVAESLILATLAILIGSFFAVQFPLLRVFDLPAGIYITAIFLAMLLIYVLVLACSLYPGRQAAGIYPAVALHEE